MMKKMFTAAAVLALGASLAFAGPGGGKMHGGKHGRGGEAHMERMAEKLNLSEGQKIQMSELRKTFQTENEPLWTAMKQTKTELKAAQEAGDTARVEALRATMKTQKDQMKVVRQAQHEKMMTILTPDQRAQLEEMRAERGHGRHKGGSRR